MRIHLFVIVLYAACHAREADVPPSSNVQVNGNQLKKEGGIIRIRTSQSGQQQFYKGCGIPRMVQYPTVCTEGKDLRHCEIQSVFYHPVSKYGRTTFVPAAPCETNQKSLLTLGDFAVFDKDGSGFVDTRELITASRVADEADSLFSTSDLNKDGFMDMCEFSKFPGSWRKILDKIRYFYFLFNIPENSSGCIEFISSFSAVQEDQNITDTIFVGEMSGRTTTITMLREEEKKIKANSVVKPSTERVPRSQVDDQLTTDASNIKTKLLFTLHTGTPPTKGTSELKRGIQLTTVASVGTHKSPSVTKTGTFLTRLGIQLTTRALDGTQTLFSFADDRAGDDIIEKRSNIKNIKMTTETISKTSDWHFDDRQWFSIMPTGTIADITKTGVSPTTEVKIRDTQEIATKTYIIDSGTSQFDDAGGIYTKMHKTSESYYNGNQIWSTELPVTSTVTPENEVKQVSKVSSKENKTDDTQIHDSDKKVTSSVAFVTNQRDDNIQDTKTAPGPNEYQGTIAAETTELFENGVPETEIRRKEKMNQFQHTTDIMKNSPIIPTAVSYEHITDYMAHSTNDLMVNEFLEINTSTEIPNKNEVAHTIISNQYNMNPGDDRSAITNFPMQLATGVILGHEHHPDDANMETLDTSSKQPSTYKSVYSQDDTDDGIDSDTMNLESVGVQPDLPLTYKGKENATQEKFNISETIYASIEKEELVRQSLQVEHTGISWSVSTTRTVLEDQLDVVNRDHVYKSKALDEDLSLKNEMKSPYLKREPPYLDRDSFYAQRKMMNGMKAIRAYNMYWIQRHDRPGFPYRHRPPFMTYPRPQLTSFTGDIQKPYFVPEIQNKQVSFISATQRSTTGVRIRDHVKGTYNNYLGLQMSAVDKSNQTIKDYPHAINEIKKTNSFANSLFSKTTEQDKDGFPGPKKHKVKENGSYNGTEISSTGKYISKTFHNIMRTPKKTQEKRKEDIDARSRLNSEVQQKIQQPKKGLQKMVTSHPRPMWTKSFEFNEKGAKEMYSWKNGDNSAEELNYSDIEVDSDERSD